MQNGSSVGIHTHCTRILARSEPLLSWHLLSKFLQSCSVGSLSRVPLLVGYVACAYAPPHVLGREVLDGEPAAGGVLVPQVLARQVLAPVVVVVVDDGALQERERGGSEIFCLPPELSTFPHLLPHAPHKIQQHNSKRRERDFPKRATPTQKRDERGGGRGGRQWGEVDREGAGIES